MKRSVIIVLSFSFLVFSIGCKQTDITSFQSNEPAQPGRHPSGFYSRSGRSAGMDQESIADTRRSSLISPASNRRVQDVSVVRTRAENRNYRSASVVNAAVSTETLAARKISQNASLNMSVEKFDEAYNKILQLIKATPGSYIASSSTSISDKGYKYGSMQIRIPAGQFNDLLVNIKTVGKVKNEYVSSNDFTREYYDLEANMRTEENYKERLEQIMRMNARNYEEVQDAYNRIRAVQERIDRIKGQMNYINSMTSYSTLNIKFYEGTYSEPTRIGNVFDRVWKGIKSGFTNMIMVLAYILEYSLTLSILIAFIIAAYFVTRKILQKKNTQ